MKFELPIFWKKKPLTVGQKDVFASIVTKSWSLVSGPLTLLFIPLFLSLELQGIWFTFISISALSMLADLGFTAIVLQFSAHESAYIKLEDGKLIGSEAYIDRLSSLFKFIIKWICLTIAIIFPVIAIIGYFVFAGKTVSFFWLIPWIIYLTASAVNLILQVLSSFIQGLGQVAKIQKLTLWFVISNTSISLMLLYFGFGIYALSLSLLFGTIIFAIVLFRKYKGLLIQLWKHNSSKGNWKGEIFPLLSRYSVSFISGYLVSQIYTPIVFHFKGAEEAGRVGLTISLISAIYTISFVWFSARTPIINVLVAKKSWRDLDSIFKSTIRHSVVTYISGISLALFVYLVFSGRNELLDRIASRFMPLTAIMILAASYLMQIFFSGSAVYLRAHKKEVYMNISLLMALYTGCSTLIIVNLFDTTFLFLGLLSSFLIFGLPIYRIFKKHQSSWHN